MSTLFPSERQENPWTRLATRTVYENPWLRLREDQVIRPDGKPGIYSVIEIKPSIGVVVLNDKREIALVGQWRYAHEKFTWEIPTGGSVPEDGSVIKAAQRELEEETGIQATNWEFLGTIDNSNGATTDVAHLYLATEIEIVNDHQDGEEQISTRWIPFDQAVDMVMLGEITESCSVAGILKVDKLAHKRVKNS